MLVHTGMPPPPPPGVGYGYSYPPPPPPDGARPGPHPVHYPSQDPHHLGARAPRMAQN